MGSRLNKVRYSTAQFAVFVAVTTETEEGVATPFMVCVPGLFPVPLVGAAPEVPEPPDVDVPDPPQAASRTVITAAHTPRDNSFRLI